MPRNAQGQYTLNPNYLVAEGETILPSQHNPVFEDIAQDLNTPRPIVAGGTGASSAVSARQNLGVYSKADVDDGFTEKVATTDELKALDTALHKVAFLLDKGKLFSWTLGDFTDAVANDPDELSYIPANGVATSIGCWVAVTGAGSSIASIAQGGTGATTASEALDNLGGMAKATYDPNSVAGDAFAMANMVEGDDAKIMTAAERTKLADAVTKSDTATTGFGFVVDEDDMSSDSDTKVPTQQSVKAYVGARYLGIDAKAADSAHADTADSSGTAANSSQLGGQPASSYARLTNGALQTFSGRTVFSGGAFNSVANMNTAIQTSGLFGGGLSMGDGGGYIAIWSSSSGGTMNFGAAGTSSGIASKMRLTSSGLAISGSISKTSGTFLIDHPLDPSNRDLAHGFVEAPRYDLIYRGKVDLIDGKATVDIDAASAMTTGTFAALTTNAVVSSLQNQTGFARVRPGEITGGTFEIVAEDNVSTDTIAWVVIAERNDPYVRHLDENCDANGRFVPDREKEEA